MRARGRSLRTLREGEISGGSPDILSDQISIIENTYSFKNYPNEQKIGINGLYLKMDHRSSRRNKMINLVKHSWGFIFNHNVSPLRHIPDLSTRHYVLQALGFMWAVTFSLAIGSYTFFAFNLLGHVVLIGAAAITIATYGTATMRPRTFALASGRRIDGEHE